MTKHDSEIGNYLICKNGFDRYEDGIIFIRGREYQIVNRRTDEISQDESTSQDEVLIRGENNCNQWFRVNITEGSHFLEKYFMSRQELRNKKLKSIL